MQADGMTKAKEGKDFFKNGAGIQIQDQDTKDEGACWRNGNLGRARSRDLSTEAVSSQICE